MENRKNEELQSRREFFKKAAKAALPVLGAVVLANLPVQTISASGCAGGSCTATCRNNCEAYCAGGCKGSCGSVCAKGCSAGCAHTSY